MKNRTIKFRVWDVESSDMIQHKDLIMGDVYLQVSEEGIRVVMDDPEGENGPEVRDAVIMQFSGLKDKHGKEIYEGDLILVLDRDWPSGTGDRYVYMRSIASICEVVFHNGCFQLSERKGHGFYRCYLDVDNGRDLFEVIGNIYENPELCQ